MKIVTGDEMHRIDRITIEERGVPGLTLMEEAGKTVAELVIERIRPKSVAVVSGKGNNAGDGFVAARYLHKAGLPVKIIMHGSKDAFSDNALTNFRALPFEIPRISCDYVEEIQDALADVDCIIDAILGTGITGEVKGIYAAAIAAVNRAGAKVVAVDIPSGLPADAEYFDGLCVHADFTVTMGLPKLGMVQYPAVGFCGEVIVAQLGFPEDLLTSVTTSNFNLITPGKARDLLPERPPDGHKGTFGSVLIVAGSPGMTGAASMTALAAARSGTGIVFVTIPQALNPILEVKLTEPITLPLQTSTEGIPDMAMFEGILKKAETVEAVALGPGMGCAPQTQQLIHELFLRLAKPLVLDADGLNAFVGSTDLLKKRTAPTILTPHPGELARLLNVSTSELQHHRIEVARKFVFNFDVILILKGARTIIAEPNGEIFINQTGNTALAKGGSGDVLTGLLTGFLAQGVKPIDAAILGVFMHGLAGEIAAREKTERAALPGDILSAIPCAFRELMQDSTHGADK